MKLTGILAAVAALATGLTAGAQTMKLTAIERSQGWRLLFDGESPEDWRGFGHDKFPPNWKVLGGSLTTDGGPGLASAEESGDFELSFDWKVGPGGHGEVYFRSAEDAKDPAETGLVMHLAGHGPTLGGNGGLTPVQVPLAPQFDVWYRSRISVVGHQVRHWINGQMVLSHTLDAPDWGRAVAASEAKAFKDYGLLPRGRIVLAGERVMFRNIKVQAK
jgi:hypothetical protein